MSVVFPCRKREFLAPSKTLQDLKEKLGPLYFDAKLIECPQNAVELAKLLQKLEELDKQKFKKLSEKSREQRVLENSLSSRYVNIKDPSCASLLSTSSSVKSFSEVIDQKKLPPGFRFHANGDPKSGVMAPDRDVVDSRTTMTSRLSATDRRDGRWRDDDDGNVDDDKLEDEITAEHTPRDPGYEEDLTKRIYGCQLLYMRNTTFWRLYSLLHQWNDLHSPDEGIDYSHEIEELEMVIMQLEAQLISQSDKSTVSEDETGSSKHNFLRAHSHSGEIFESCMNRTSANYAYDPEQQYRLEKRPGSQFLGSRFKPAVSKTSKCLACQFKLKHVGNEFLKSNDKGITKERWHIAPSGCFVASPTISAKSSLRLIEQTQQSRESMVRDSSGGLPGDSSRGSAKTLSRRHGSSIVFKNSSSLTSNTSPRRRRDGTQSHTSSITSNVSGRHLDGTQSHASGMTPRVFSGRRLDGTQSHTTGRASSKLQESRQDGTQSNTSRRVVSSTVGSTSSLRRFSSPLQKDSRMQMLRSQVEQDTYDCQQKVDAFIDDLKSHKKLTESKHRWEHD